MVRHFPRPCVSGCGGAGSAPAVAGNAVRGGNDTDTVAAIAGGLIGAAAGYPTIPADWLGRLHGWGATGERALVKLSLDLVAGRRRPDHGPRVPATDYNY
ncbi:ADP-ribosylglycohydrolase family protein [Arthrobacter sp. SDTb3-6]|uniref:ADP-ribosylglycohydrolase family protein n=1 Tax=Arthrobacter sp. SDTb3-6 TaxID=2713571 RepID=UPI001C40063A